MHAGRSAEARVPALVQGAAEPAPARSGHPGEQPPVVLRPLLRPAPAAAQGGVPGQGRVLHRPGAQGPGQPGVLQRRRADSDRPDGRRGQRARAAVGAAGARGREGPRHLPGGHPLAGRAAVQGPYRSRPAGPGVPGARGALRDDAHLRVPPAGLAQPAVQRPAGGGLRSAAGILPLLRPGDGPGGAARGDRRNHGRAGQALRPGVRLYLCEAGAGIPRGGRAGDRFITVIDCSGRHCPGLVAARSRAARLASCEWESLPEAATVRV